MISFHRTKSQPALFAAVAIAATTIACDKPMVAEGKAATVGGIEFKLGDHKTQYIEVSDGSNTYEYPEPALVIGVTFKNVGEGDFTYNPTHATQQMAEAQTPLLYLDPGPEEKLPPESKTLINGVYLQKGTMPGQVKSNETIKAGAEISDLFLFEVPDEETKNLILSIPPSMHRGRFPVLFRIAYSPQQPEGPSVHAVGEPVAFEVGEFTVTATDIKYVKTKDSAQGEGFSSDPLLKIDYKVTNTSDQPITYNPAHRDVGGRGAALFGKGQTYKRVKFAATTAVEGQMDGAVQVAPGESVEDFVLFERPAEGAEQLVFEYPASLFGGQGIARVRLEYEHKTPPLPKELKKAEKKDGEESKGG